MMNWRKAFGDDVNAILDLTQDQYKGEMDTIFTPDRNWMAQELTIAICRQFFNPLTELVLICHDEDNNLIGWTWATRGVRVVWAREEMVEVKMCHLDLNQTTKTRVRMMADLLRIWQDWAVECGVPVLFSSTNRRDQLPFLQLHARAGWDVRGSFAYRRLVPLDNQTEVEEPSIIIPGRR
jgi:hypothetical protein